MTLDPQIERLADEIRELRQRLDEVYYAERPNQALDITSSPTFASVITSLIGPVTNGGKVEIVSTGTLANLATFSFGARSICRLDIVDVNGNIAIFGVTSGGVTHEYLDPSGGYADTSTGGVGCFYKSGANLIVENRIGSDWSWTVVITSK